MIVLAVDPGSKVSGYATLASSNCLVECGFLRPRRTRDPLDARVLAMDQDLRRALDECKPQVVVIESVSPHPMKRHGSGGGHGLASYGFAVGVLYHRAYFYAQTHGCRFAAYAPGVWTGRVSKWMRQRALAAQFDTYRAIRKKDSGGDVADAIALAQYWFEQEAMAHAQSV